MAATVDAAWFRSGPTLFPFRRTSLLKGIQFHALRRTGCLETAYPLHQGPQRESEP